MARHRTGPPDHERASLRTIAGLVGAGAAACEAFAAVAREVGRVTGCGMVLIQGLSAHVVLGTATAAAFCPLAQREAGK